ncbi:DUF1707 domain-containing protein [Kribbella sp. NPDC056861]|uniref:DUF1707 SHOCT-like domain-containing protein n=1 Tax=Kribbella sp. NPDC056861 TaxID=3154857 RepID=UPI0034442901
MSEERSMRVGDREREEAVARLGEHYEAGRLSAEEHQERVGEALQAKTQAELAALFVDLPGKSADPGKTQYQPAWKGTKRPPVPVLVALALVASVACVVLGGHPPVLPLALLVIGVVFLKRRRRA